MFLYSNHKPLVRGTDYGFWRRMRLIPFIETITDDEKDTELPDKLKAEADGILTWIVDGAVHWQQEGLGLPDEVAQATAGYRSEMDSIGALLIVPPVTASPSLGLCRRFLLRQRLREVLEDPDGKEPSGLL